MERLVIIVPPLTLSRSNTLHLWRNHLMRVKDKQFRHNGGRPASYRDEMIHSKQFFLLLPKPKLNCANLSPFFVAGVVLSWRSRYLCKNNTNSNVIDCQSNCDEYHFQRADPPSLSFLLWQSGSWRLRQTSTSAPIQWSHRCGVNRARKGCVKKLLTSTYFNTQSRPNRDGCRGAVTFTRLIM